MLTLIKREIKDHFVYFIAAVIFASIIIGLFLSLIFEYRPMYRLMSNIGIVITMTAIVIFGFYAMGAAQMYTDKNRRISAFLSTLPVSRSRILIAKMVTGMLAILTLLVPLAIVPMILLRIFTPPIPLYSGVVFEVFIGMFLSAFACYCIGLQAGWNSSSLMPALGGLGLTCILLSLILVKGFGLHIIVILLFFIAASLIRIWHLFTSTSL
jgi:hypothetical protein